MGRKPGGREFPPGFSYTLARMDPMALIPLVFWFVVGVFVGIPIGRRVQRRSVGKRFRQAFSEAEKRANLAAVPHLGQTYTASGRPVPSPFFTRNRLDPDATAELHVLPENDGK